MNFRPFLLYLLCPAKKHIVDEEVIVLGAGIAGLSAAYELVKRGIKPTVIEARQHLGGLTAAGYVGGVRLDLGAESYALRSAALNNLCAELGLEVKNPQEKSWIWKGGAAAPIAQGVWGIPSSWKDPAFEMLTAAEYAVARKDLELASDIGADAKTLGELVRTRLGAAVLEKMVAPVAGGVHTADPEILALSAIAPGIVPALRAEGSLIAAVRRLRPKNTPILGQPVGGMHQVAFMLAKQIEKFGGKIRRGLIATDVLHDKNGFSILVAKSAGTRAKPRPVRGSEEVITAPKLLIAVDGVSALELLRKISPLDIPAAWKVPQGAKIAGVTLIIKDPALDAAPRGSGALIEPSAVAVKGRVVEAKALTHYSVKWPWAADALAKLHGGSTHAIRLSYGRSTQQLPYPAVREAFLDAQAVLDCEIAAENLLDARIVSWGASLSPQTPTHRKNLECLTEQLAQIPGLAATGAWIAGTGLGAVVTHAVKTGAEFA